MLGFDFDVTLDMLYLFQNPYRISRKFLQKRGETDIYQYGETPESTMHWICINAGLYMDDHFFELGAGRGKAALFVADFFGCDVTAIEQIPEFVRKAKLVNKMFSLGVHFRCEDYLESDLSKATIIYLFGTCLTEEQIKKLCTKFLPKQKIISISYPLSDYDARYKITAKFPVEYPFGKTDAYINVLVNSDRDKGAL